MKSLRYLAFAVIPLSLAAAAMDDIPTMIGKADELMKDTVMSLNAAGEYSSTDRQMACTQAKRAQSDLTQLGSTVDAISTAMQSDSSMTSDDRASWAAMADKMNDFIRSRRETAMNDWRILC
jgi:hypothetical protein